MGEGNREERGRGEGRGKKVLRGMVNLKILIYEYLIYE